MSRVCQVTGKRPSYGNNVSHANNKTSAALAAEPAHAPVLAGEREAFRAAAGSPPRGMRTIDKLGIEKVVADLRARGVKV